MKVCYEKFGLLYIKGYILFWRKGRNVEKDCREIYFKLEGLVWGYFRNLDEKYWKFKIR